MKNFKDKLEFTETDSSKFDEVPLESTSFRINHLNDFNINMMKKRNVKTVSPKNVDYYKNGKEILKVYIILEKNTLVLDLDETLVHSSIENIQNADIELPILVDNNVYKVKTLIRPWTFDFLYKLSEFYDIIIFTASHSIVNYNNFSMQNQ